MNNERLGVIASWLEGGAGRTGCLNGFDMRYGARIDPNGGYTACVAGAVCHFFAPEKLKSWTEGLVASEIQTEWFGLVPAQASFGRIYAEAKELLDLNNEQAERLFYPPLYVTDKERVDPAWAARCIRTLMATGEFNWFAADQRHNKPTEESSSDTLMDTIIEALSSSIIAARSRPRFEFSLAGLSFARLESVDRPMPTRYPIHGMSPSWISNGVATFGIDMAEPEREAA